MAVPPESVLVSDRDIEMPNSMIGEKVMRIVSFPISSVCPEQINISPVGPSVSAQDRRHDPASGR